MNKHLAPFALSIGLGFALLAPNPVLAEEHGAHGSRFSQEDKAAFLDARIAALKAGLKLTPAQEKLWPAVESALRAYDQTKKEQMGDWRKAAREEHQHKDFIDHLRRKAQFLSAYATETNKLADAVKPLYDTLDEAQKHRLVILLRVAQHGRGAMGASDDGASAGAKSDDNHDGK